MNAQVTVTQKPVSPGRARYSPLKPSRRECRVSASPVVTMLVCFFTFAHWAAGAAKHPAFPAPSSVRKARFSVNSGAIVPRECQIASWLFEIQIWKSRATVIKPHASCSPQYSGKRVGSPPTSDGVESGWRSIGRLLFSRANVGKPIAGGNA
jgi:hypothetical protein